MTQFLTTPQPARGENTTHPECVHSLSQPHNHPNFYVSSARLHLASMVAQCWLATAAALLVLAASVSVTSGVEDRPQTLPVMFSDWRDANNGKAKVDSVNYGSYEESELQGEQCWR